MKAFEDELRDRLRNGQDAGQPTERENIWAALQRDLPPPGPPSPPPTGPATGIYWATAVLLLLLTVGVLWPTHETSSPPGSKDYAAQTPALQTEKTPDPSLPTPRAVTTEPIGSASPPPSEPSTTPNSARPAATPRVDAFSTPPARPTKVPGSMLSARAPVPTGSTGSDLTPAGRPVTDPGPELRSDFAVAAAPSGSPVLPASPTADTTATVPRVVMASAASPLPTVPPASILPDVPVSLLPGRTTALRVPPPLPPSPAPAPALTRPRGPRFELAAVTGTHLLLRRYRAAAGSDGRLAEALAAATGNAAGQQAGLELRYRLHRNFRLGLGLEYARTHNTFRYAARYDTVVAHPSFPLTQETGATAERVLAYNNHLSVLTLPLTLDITRQFGRFRLSLGAGVGWNLVNYRRGATLDAAGRPGYYAAVTEQQLSYHFRPRLGWTSRRHPRTGFFLGADARRLRLGAGLPEGVVGNAWLLGGQVGFRYGL